MTQVMMTQVVTQVMMIIGDNTVHNTGDDDDTGDLKLHPDI